jgi:alkylation response protein AidB-like acyl-CoA dehydrogenase
MDLDPSDDQRALQETVARLAADRFDMERVREWGEPGGFSAALWQELAALGTFGIAVPEADGGVGLATIDSVLVHETLGAALTPGPLVAASVLGGAVAGVSIDGVVDGTVVPTLVRVERGLGADPTGAMVVEHLRDADVLVVLTDGEVRSYDAATLDRTEAAHPTDPTMPVSLVRGLAEVGGTLIGGAEESHALRRVASLLASAQLVGLAEAATTLAVQYASDRQQFGRPVGSFQGLKHLLADCYVRTEVARSAVWAAGVTLDEPEAGDADRAVAGARLLAARAGADNAKTCVQVHGGMGFTWEVDAHLYMKRAWVLETMFGSADDAAEAVAATL